MTPLERRHAAIEATMARYRDRPFAWGKVDCAKVAAVEVHDGEPRHFSAFVIDQV